MNPKAHVGKLSGAPVFKCVANFSTSGIVKYPEKSIPNPDMVATIFDIFFSEIILKRLSVAETKIIKNIPNP